ncbi:MAG: molecular chaperone HtpG [Litorilinea sp.]
MTEETNATEPNATEPMEYRTEVKQLLDILAHSLYTDREIFLRELISNASDALHRVQFEMLTNPDVVDADAELAIRIELDAEARTLMIADSGIGMNRDELIENLGTIAHSGAKNFLQNARENQATVEEIIGQFGVGFYSVFMVAHEVRVRTRSFRTEDQGWEWRSQGDSQFTLQPLEKASRGTEIFIQLKEDAEEFASAWRIEQIVQRHSDYVSFPIVLIGDAPDTEDVENAKDADGEARAPEPKTLNRQTALWRQRPGGVEADEYNEFYRQLTLDRDDPLVHVHMVADAPVNVRAILYIPTQRERGRMGMAREHGLRLYSRKILIQERNQDLLPDYYRFVDGVVDSDDLPLNVSREMVQSNPVMRQLQRALANRIARELKNLAQNDAEKYTAFWREFGVFLKEGIAMDLTGQDSLRELLRFQSSTRGDDWISLNDYVAAMAADQEAIYYVLGEDVKAAARSPHLEYFRAQKLEVLYLVDPIDGFMVSSLREFEGKPLRNVDDAGLDLPEKDAEARATEEDAQNDSALDDAQFTQLVEKFTATLGERVRGIRASRQLVSSPCRLVSPEDSFDRDLQRILRMTEEGYEAPTKLLELNRKHPLIVNLGRMIGRDVDELLVTATIEQLFSNAQLLDGQPANPVDMVDRIQTLMEAAVASKVPPESKDAA